MTKLRALPEL